MNVATGVELVPRKHVVAQIRRYYPGGGRRLEKRHIVPRGRHRASMVHRVRKARDLGVLLKYAPQSLSKKNMLAYWDTFGEVFGMPIRIQQTMSQDTKETSRGSKPCSPK